MAESKLRDLSTEFAVKVIKLCDGIKGIIPSSINWSVRQPLLVQTFTKRTMPTEKPTLLLNSKYRSKNVMKRNIGLSFCLKADTIPKTQFWTDVLKLKGF